MGAKHEMSQDLFDFGSFRMGDAEIHCVTGRDDRDLAVQHPIPRGGHADRDHLRPGLAVFDARGKQRQTSGEHTGRELPS